ncbi:Dolichyl-diphosphooligosaccharide--protein glycosyltransferase subunit 1 [Heracleum sosnowskyi]|uniref:Dolichyl-diphosphooligosaccharide--protein glycosyltransferase subunit 1 n=1 Tax=Heracleum sosnowskyi TaxID=360622 RepID=A0AAD8M749_9APIA|nr:Dolichyl-diphosphooligosaccharide--protein glycosyltransferase subunit 1 [Heracleum sosnowskyi]
MKGGMSSSMCLLVSIIITAASLLSSPVASDLVISKLDRRVDLTSQIVRVTSTLKVKCTGPEPVSDVLVAFPEHQTKFMNLLLSTASEGKGKPSAGSVSIRPVQPDGVPPSYAWFLLTLPKQLGKGESITLNVFAAFTRILQPFPEKITQGEDQMVVFKDSGYFLSPYLVKVQSLTFRLPEGKVESYTKMENSKLSGSEIKYGPYENVPAFQQSPVAIHFVNNLPFVVAKELVREIEVSHWGNVQVTEHYNLFHGGAQSTGEFSRLDFQARGKGPAAFRSLVAKLPARAHSIYYRDAIGNISTSNIYGDTSKTLLEIEPRYPMFGGWRTSFTIGYGLPLQDYLFHSDGKRLLNFTFGCPMDDVVVEKLLVKIVLPEGSTNISASVPFPVQQSEETKFSHLDMVGRPVVVLEKRNVVPEHNLPFQVHYKFSKFSLLREPLMLITGFFLLFVACITYMNADLTISKFSPSYLAKLQWDEVQAAIQQVQNIIYRSLTIHDKLEGSLRDLSRTGDVQVCKAVRKTADSSFKELSKELKPLLTFLQSSPQALPIFSKVDDLVAKERDLQEKMMLKHSTVVDSYEKKSGRDIENKIVSIQQKISALRKELDELLDIIDEI